MTNLLKRLKKELETGLPFMEGRENGKITCEMKYTITDFGYLRDKKTQQPYVCFISKENEQKFFFGGSVVTDTFKKIEAILSSEELAQILNEGLQVVFHEQKSKDNLRTYIVMELV